MPGSRKSTEPLLQLLAKEGLFKRSLLNDERSFSILDTVGFAKMIKLVKEFVPEIVELNEKFIHNNLTLDSLVIQNGKIEMKESKKQRHIQDQYRIRAGRERQKLLEYGVKRDRVDELLESYKPALMDDVLQTDLLSLIDDIDSVINSPWGRVYLKKYLRWSRLYGNSDGFTCDRIRALNDLPV